MSSKRYKLACAPIKDSNQPICAVDHVLTVAKCRAFSSNFGKEAPCQNREEMINLTTKLGEIKHIEHNKGSKIYPQNQVILDCIMPSIPHTHKCVSIILIWIIVSHK